MQPRVDGVMVSVLVIVVSAGRVKPKTIKLEFVATPLSTQQLQGVRANSCWIGLSRDNVSSGATCLPADYCFSGLAITIKKILLSMMV